MGFSFAHATIILIGTTPLVLVGVFMKQARASKLSETEALSTPASWRWRAIVVPVLGMGGGVGIATAAIYFGGAWAGAALMATILASMPFRRSH